ncbi:isoprenoid synthase domain-containing protein [Suillus subaureus]|uniref:(2E,6E)-farnesyl diphosphate synthase n=1 Tax=Suillus subaureus TaxID=48587 RepID=A0A9P7EDJ3_9AGAM|nr:isoprenoid synthase domain-containing protein [Suillus subaureus]KAG1818092.1 isoprenoid synthase domain-containing protein [Suillus subaureus]
MSHADTRNKFLAVFEGIREELVAHMKSEKMPEDAIAWFNENLIYNVPGGKLNRGVSVVDTVTILLNRPPTDDEYFRAALLGWCIELLQAFFLVSDDIMDDSISRRGQPCWYRVSNVKGLGKVHKIAINDSCMLEGAIYHILKNHFRRESYYVDLLELFQEVTYKTEMGQLVDQITAPEDNIDIGRYTLLKHAFIVRYKTAYYSFYLSVALAMRMCGVPDVYELNGKTVEPYKEADRILIPMGEFFQVQDDYLDYHGTEAQIGKIGTDIIDGKCSWCVCMALTHGTDTQTQFLLENYGKKGPEQAMREQAVKNMYNDDEGLNIPKRYEEYSKNTVTEINTMIELVPEPDAQDELRGDRLRRDVFRAFLSKITDRTA